MKQSRSLIVPWLTCFFGIIRYLSVLELGRHLFGTWKSYRAVEIYVLCWLCINLLFLGLIFSFPNISNIPIFFVIVMILLILRLVDLLQVSFNVLLFDRIRTGKNYQIASPTRLLILNLFNYVEITIIFGIIGFLARNSFYPSFQSAWDSLYYSIGVITTIGSNVEPIAWQGRVMFLSEIILGLVFILLIIGRAISLLPSVKHIDKY